MSQISWIFWLRLNVWENIQLCPIKQFLKRFTFAKTSPIWNDFPHLFSRINFQYHPIQVLKLSRSDHFSSIKWMWFSSIGFVTLSNSGLQPTMDFFSEIWFGSPSQPCQQFICGWQRWLHCSSLSINNGCTMTPSLTHNKQNGKFLSR